jgi:ATP-binding cassette, subfamily B, bacterial
MKSTWIKLKWISRHARPFLFFLLLLIVIGAISSVTDIYRAIITKKLIDASIAAQRNLIIQYIIFMFMLILANVMSHGTISVLSIHCSANITNNIQKKIYNHLTKTEWMEYSKYHTGDILTRMTSDVETVTNLVVNILPDMITLTVLLCGSFITLLYYSPTISIAAIILAILTILIGRFYAVKQKGLYIKSQEVEGKYLSFLSETLQNMVIIKTFNLEEDNMHHINKIQKSRFKLLLSSNRNATFTNTIFLLGSWLGFFLIMSWGSFNIAKGIITFGTLMALLQLFSNIQGPISGLASSLVKLISAIASTERLMELEALQVDFNSSQEVALTSVGIEFENVNFSYKKLEPILKNICTNINPGEIVALIGPSGEGKTTLIRLLISLIKPEKGHAYISKDNEKYEISASSRKFIAYVPQGNTLFSGTIADNLRLGFKDATDKELEAAARGACAWEFISNLTDGLYTVIGERGMGLSEGQAQRLAIARALLRKVPILVLDEATSSLDTETEIKVLQTIRNLNPSPTCIIITHRTTALKICNRVLKLKDGYLMEVNNYVSTDEAM